MPQTIETLVYSFDELSEDAKKKAIEWYRENGLSDWFFAEYIFEEAADIADLFGLDIRQTRKTLKDGSTRYDPTIYYSGFWSQGDGACFEGQYRYKKGALKAVRAYAPNNPELHRIVKELQDIQKWHFYKLGAVCKHRGHYSHSGCMRVEVFHTEDNYKDIGNAEDDITQALRDFADWIYQRLEKEWEYQNSEDVIIENIRINEYQFTEDGKIF